ncbi:hypothetical protein LINPERHAP2_LOCUS28932 [Linum perenne]
MRTTLLITKDTADVKALRRNYEWWCYQVEWNYYKWDVGVDHVMDKTEGRKHDDIFSRQPSSCDSSNSAVNVLCLVKNLMTWHLEFGDHLEWNSIFCNIQYLYMIKGMASGRYNSKTQMSATGKSPNLLRRRGQQTPASRSSAWANLHRQ